MEIAKAQVMITEDVRKKAARLIALKAIMEANKPLYEEIDRLILELKDAMGVGQFLVTLSEQESLLLHNGEVTLLASEQVVNVIDNFAEKNTVFRPAGVKRFDATNESLLEFNARAEKAKKKAKKR